MWSELINSIRLSWHIATSPDRGRVLSVTKKLKTAQKGHPKALTDEERGLLDSIRQQTGIQNRNNLTRTEAYLQYFLANPEVHWSLLAHVVSRNGGWGMTDLRGEWFSRISTSGEPNEFFAFLERANWLIFSDAYPQLLLYEAAKKRGRDLSYLLPELHVSRLMPPIWNDFWQTRDSHLLTRALIVNEQNYIESRVVQNAVYSQAVLGSIQYQLQSLLNLNQVVIPFRKGGTVRLGGTAARHFASLEDRIETGKRLYKILFQDKFQTLAMLTWTQTVPHTASRADYWPDFFTPKYVESSRPYEPRFLQNGLQNRRIYSPRLQDVWSDVHHNAAETNDWFQDSTCFIHLFDPVKRQPRDYTDTYLESARTIENILIAKEKVISVLK